jgi:hypothetical protein
MFQRGKLEFQGATSHAIAHYLPAEKESEWVRNGAAGSIVWVQRVTIQSILQPADSTDLFLDIEIISTANLDVSLDVVIKDGLLQPLAFATTGTHQVRTPTPIRKGVNRCRAMVNLPRLALGRYTISVFLTQPFVKFYDRVDDIVCFRIDHSDLESKQPLDQSWGFGSLSLPLSLEHA